MRNLKWLKKSTALLLTIALAGSLAACGSKADEAPAAETTQETEAAAEETTEDAAAAEEPVAARDLTRTHLTRCLQRVS